MRENAGKSATTHSEALHPVRYPLVSDTCGDSPGDSAPVAGAAICQWQHPGIAPLTCRQRTGSSDRLPGQCASSGLHNMVQAADINNETDMALSSENILTAVQITRCCLPWLRSVLLI